VKVAGASADHRAGDGVACTVGRDISDRLGDRFFERRPPIPRRSKASPQYASSSRESSYRSLASFAEIAPSRTPMTTARLRHAVQRVVLGGGNICAGSGSTMSQLGAFQDTSALRTKSPVDIYADVPGLSAIFSQLYFNRARKYCLRVAYLFNDGVIKMVDYLGVYKASCG